MWERDDLFIVFFWRTQFLFRITFGPGQSLQVCKQLFDNLLKNDALKVVKADRPDLEEQKAALTRQQNEYKILLKERPKFRQEQNIFFIRYSMQTWWHVVFQGLEDDLLQRLSAAGDDILRWSDACTHIQTRVSNSLVMCRTSLIGQL